MGTPRAAHSSVGREKRDAVPIGPAASRTGSMAAGPGVASTRLREAVGKTASRSLVEARPGDLIRAVQLLEACRGRRGGEGHLPVELTRDAEYTCQPAGAAPSLRAPLSPLLKPGLRLDLAGPLGLLKSRVINQGVPLHLYLGTVPSDTQAGPGAEKLFKTFFSKQWDTGCTTRSLYNDLLMKDAHVPTVCLNKRSVPWSLSFQSVQHPLLENRLKDTAWLVAHHALKTNALLYSKWRFIRSGTCPRNNCNGFETMDHVMWSCNEVLLTWTWVEGFIRRWVVSDFRINRHMVIFGIVPTTWPKCKKDVIIYIIAIAVTRKRIWSSRCEALFDKTFVTHVEIVPYIMECLRSRLKLDFVRLGEAAFLAQWCSSVRWAKVVGGKLRLRF
ncbi:hypothetical protein Bbelb_166710 [Branchiostoma belcheri]|nr:hypothetical protein Bbelb_166710 [Branchiostoma belcheri]